MPRRPPGGGAAPALRPGASPWGGRRRCAHVGDGPPRPPGRRTCPRGASCRWPGRPPRGAAGSATTSRPCLAVAPPGRGSGGGWRPRPPRAAAGRPGTSGRPARATRAPAPRAARPPRPPRSPHAPRGGSSCARSGPSTPPRCPSVRLLASRHCRASSSANPRWHAEESTAAWLLAAHRLRGAAAAPSRGSPRGPPAECSRSRPGRPAPEAAPWRGRTPQRRPRR
mmetsp:Transcript_90413/g.269783  ORF Transcript_90413/g.269783 Transcript_90413/m.269783 type:complete len:225 (+) Transcript_90413:875-1549(+)